MQGVFAVWKLKGPTSNDVLNEIRKIAGTRAVGHAGTLDPLAEGILVVGIGREATKKLGEAVKKEKEYLAKIHLGVTSVTDDEEGEKIRHEVKDPPTKERIKHLLTVFVGKIFQIPPVYSAVKIKGKEAYKYARAGEEIKLEPREVEIKSIEITAYKWPTLELKVLTGPGVYIRALARDLGELLGCGAYLSGLIRTRVGNFTATTTIKIDNLKEFLTR